MTIAALVVDPPYVLVAADRRWTNPVTGEHGEHHSDGRPYIKVHVHPVLPSVWVAAGTDMPRGPVENLCDPRAGADTAAAISRLFTDWYWRYTPQPYVLGKRTLGTIDMTTDPGTDRGTNKSVMFSRLDGNLVELQLSANADQFVTGTTLTSVAGTDGGGVAYWRDIGSVTKYGVIDDQILAVTAPSFAEQRKMVVSVSNNRVNLNSAGSKTAVVLRDAQTADKWRELDKVMIHDPEQGINYLVARVISYTFDEGHGSQTLTLDQFSVDDTTIPIKRLQQGAFQVAAKFNTR